MRYYIVNKYFTNWKNSVRRKFYEQKEFNSLLDKGVKLNYQAGMRLYCGYEDEDYDPVDDFIMWTDFPLLVKWLPGTYEENEIPVRLEPEIITTAEREAEIMEGLTE